MSQQRLLYVCENDDCPREGEIQAVARDATAECSYCGWFMSAAD